MLEQLKHLDLDRISLEEAVELAVYAKLLHAEFEAQQVDVPAWLDDRSRELKREIRVRQQDAVEKRIRELKARREALLPAEEKRTKIEQEIATLEAKMAGQ
jgi:hypothetical protein